MKAYRAELIGKEVMVDSLHGKIVDETLHMLKIQTKKGIKQMIKKNHTFKIEGKDVSGILLIGRPEERLVKR